MSGPTAWRGIGLTCFAMSAMAASIVGVACKGADDTTAGVDADARDAGVSANRPCSLLADPGVTVEYEAVTTDGHYVVVAFATSDMQRRVFYAARA